MTENNGKVWQKKVMSGVTTQGRRKEEEVGTSLLGNDKNNVIVNYLFIKLVFVLKFSGLNGYLKSMINMLPKKININFLLDADSLKISVFYLF